jgi:type II secretory pathway component GspD/PulD (secretin)
MKAKVSTLVLAGFVMFRLAGLAQDTSAAGGEQPKPAAAAPAVAPPADLSAVIPLIAIDDQPLTDAIKILARQADLNYLIDPKVVFGVPRADGTVAPQPNVSIRWERVTAQQALEALLGNYNLQLVEDPKTKISRVTVKDPAADEPLVTKVIQLKYAGPSNVLDSVRSVLTDPKKRSKVVADIRTSQLVVVATEKELAGVEELLKQLDTPTKQVLIEAKILETTVNPKSVKGIDWTSTLSKQNITFGNGITSGKTTTTFPGTPTTVTLPGGRTITTTPDSSSQTVLDTVLGNGGVSLNTLKGFSPQTAFLNADGLNVALSFLNNSSDTKVISEPRAVTLDNQKATIEVGRLYPIVNVSASTANTTGGSQISYSNLTVNLDVTPRITANNFVELKVLQSILRLGPQTASKVGGVDNVVDSFFTRKVETTVLIPSGNTLVMGGLVSDENTSANTKVPLLGDIPVLGLAFRKDTKERNRQNLLIFITPTIVKDTDFQPAQSKFLQSTGKGAVKEEWSAWDSGKPLDWSNPEGTPPEEAAYDEKLGALKADTKPRPELPPK